MVERAPEQRGSGPLAALPLSVLEHRVADPEASLAALATGIIPLDAFAGGLALRRTHLLTGTDGSGVSTLLHACLAAISRAHPVLLLDAAARFHPPAACAAGVHLPHILWVRETNPDHLWQAMTVALRDAACPLVVLDLAHAPAAATLDRVRPLVRRGSALLFVVRAETPIGTGIDGMTLRVSHGAWEGVAGRPGCGGRTLAVHATDHQRGQTTTFPFTVTFLKPLPPLHALTKKGGRHGASAAHRGDLDTGAAPAMRGAG